MLKPTVRKCSNIKSRKNPDVQCPLSASHGDYCMRHAKNPRPYIGHVSPRMATRRHASAANTIRRFWKVYSSLYIFRTQGPAANDLSLAVNDTELYSLESVHTIPRIYRFSFSDEKKTIWIFDIRTLAYSLAKGAPQQNPYTRDILGPRIMEQIHARISWLRDRRYQILHVNTDALTPEQLWNQHVLDFFLKMESLGYYVSSDWFHQMNIPQHARFYIRLQQLWDWKLGLTMAEKNVIIPRHMTLFRFVPTCEYLNKSLRWWQKISIGLIEHFVTGSDQRDKRALGTLYILIGLVQVSPAAAEALPWVVDAVP